MRRGIVVLLGCLALAGCGQVTQAEQECPNGVLVAEGKCKTVQAAQEQKRDEAIRKEAGEAEDVLRKRRAEELANAAEGR
jgi:predicted aminopeptidase